MEQLCFDAVAHKQRGQRVGKLTCPSSPAPVHLGERKWAIVKGIKLERNKCEKYS